MPLNTLLYLIKYVITYLLNRYIRLPNLDITQ